MKIPPMTVTTTPIYKAGDRVTVTFDGTPYQGTVAERQHGNGGISVDIDGVLHWCRPQFMKPYVPMTHRVFVYGTLKRGYGNHAFLLSEAHFAGEAVTPPMFRMLEPSFPVVLEQPGGLPVAGELYHVDDATLARLDDLEGVQPGGGGMYERKEVDVVESGHKVKAHIYIGCEDRWARSGCPAYTKVNAAGALDWQRR